MNSTLYFRAVLPADIPLVRALAATIWRVSYAEMISPAQIDYMLNSMYGEMTIQEELAAGTRWELAELDGQSVGFLSCTAEPETQRLKMNKLYLLPGLQGRGYGQEMVTRVFTHARHSGSREVWLQVNKRNLRAIRCYERAGFSVERSDVFEIGCGFVMDDFVMCAAVPASAAKMRPV